MKLVGFKSSFFPIREANQGTRVNPTNKLVSVEVITTIENCLSISATNTCKKRIGKKQPRSTRVIEIAENPISIRPSICSSHFVFAHIQMPLNVFQNYNGIIYQNSDN